MATQKERSRRWYLANRDTAIKRAAIWRNTNPEKISQIRKRYNEKIPIEVRREYLRKWSSENVEKIAGYTRKRKYGISTEEFEKMFLEQDGRCDICSKKFSRSPHLDHDHISGKNRKLLCANCNWVLGYAHDDIAILGRAIQYLKAHGVKSNVHESSERCSKTKATE